MVIFQTSWREVLGTTMPVVLQNPGPANYGKRATMKQLEGKIHGFKGFCPNAQRMRNKQDKLELLEQEGKYMLQPGGVKPNWIIVMVGYKLFKRSK